MTGPVSRPPVWQSIADTLTAEIAAGQYSPGTKLPPEARLAARFGVNRHTLRRAMARLTEQGLTHPRRGAGVFVTMQPTEYRLGRRVRFHQNVADTGRTPSRRILGIETRGADPAEAQALALPPGAAVHAFDGVSLADGVPLAVFRSVFPAARFPELPLALAQTGSVTAALRAAGVADYTRASTRITATVANPVTARLLQVADGAPLLRTVAINVDDAARPVERGTTWFAGERVALFVPQS